MYLIRKLYAAGYDFGMRLAGGRFDPCRRALLAGARGRVLELGIGTGQNVRFYPAGIWAAGVDPDPAMMARARARVAAAGARITLVGGAAEALPFPEAAFDTVVATLVFCSVPNPERSFEEVRRVLKQGGRLLFMEHVRSPSSGWAAFQDFVTPTWKLITGGE